MQSVVDAIKIAAEAARPSKNAETIKAPLSELVVSNNDLVRCFRRIDPIQRSLSTVAVAPSCAIIRHVLPQGLFDAGFGGPPCGYRMR